MSSSFNQTILIGNLGCKPELISSQFATVSLAVNEIWKDDKGKTQSRTDWFTVLLNGHLAKFACAYLSKGSMVLIKGKLRTSEWKNESGQTLKSIQVYAQEIVPCGKSELKAEEEKNEPPKNKAAEKEIL